MRSRKLLLLISCATLGMIGCPAGYIGVCDDGACDSPDGSIDAGGDSGPDAPPGCDPNADPKDSPACVADGFGIFVDATNGKDSNTGTKEAPVQTIAHALDAAKGQNLKRVYVCEGTYAEDLSLDAGHGGISVYGGWKCSDWSYSATKPVVGKTQLAAKLDSLTSAVVVEDLEFDAAAGDSTNVSSTAMLVSGCATVHLARLKLVAGVGHDGGVGTLANYTYPAQTTLNGNAADGGTPGPANTYSGCTSGGTTVGGAGGASGVNGNPGTPGDAGAGGSVVACINNNTGGGNGSGGADGQNGGGANVTGSLSGAGWAPANGADGQPGDVGQGGGGGAGAGGSGGGGGGAGGCGGAPGTKGMGGGASIALAVLGSGLTVDATMLATATAGKGGSGVAGQPGQTPGGFGGNPGPGGCLGGKGGTGGAGGAGGGGAGGISVGVLWSGTQPTLDSATQSSISVGTKGLKGTGGASGQNDGIDGVAQPVMQAP